MNGYVLIVNYIHTYYVIMQVGVYGYVRLCNDVNQMHIRLLPFLIYLFVQVNTGITLLGKVFYTRDVLHVRRRVLLT